jgi:thiol-disulfide isomerase/thioredoxin
MDTHGESHRLYDYLEDGKVVVLDFFFTTCGPCIYYSPQVNLAYEKYGCNTRDVIFMGIDWDDTREEVIAYDETYGIQYPSIAGLNGGNEIVNAYNILGFPTFYVIDSTKRIIEQIDPPTLQVFDFRFNQLGIQPMDCDLTSVKDPDASPVVNLYPNPATNRFDITCESGQILQVEIFDMEGKLRFSQKTESGSRQLEVQTHLPPGLYFVSILTVDQQKQMKELIIIK